MKDNIAKTFQVLVTVVLTILVAFTLFHRYQPKLDERVQLDSGYRFVMGTIARVVVVTDSRVKAIDCIEKAFKRITGIESLMSYRLRDSEISKVNRNAYDRPVKLGADCFEVLQKAHYYSELTGGSFDITAGPLVELWHKSAKKNEQPAEHQIKQAKEKVGFQNLILDVNEKSVRFAVEGMKLDLGGIAKGYAIDEAVEQMQRLGAVGGMVDIGGDIRCFGLTENEKWRIGVQDPRVEANSDDFASEPLLVLQLTDAAVATSGDYRRFSFIDDRRYSHIIDVNDGVAARGLSSVTIISGTAIHADAIATAVCVMGSRKGLELVNRLPDTEAVLITGPPDCEIIETKAAAQYVKSRR